MNSLILVSFQKSQRPQALLLPAGETVITNPQGAQHLGSHSREKPLYEITHKRPTTRWERDAQELVMELSNYEMRNYISKSRKVFPTENCIIPNTQ